MQAKQQGDPDAQVMDLKNGGWATWQLAWGCNGSHGVS